MNTKEVQIGMQNALNVRQEKGLKEIRKNKLERSVRTIE
jgi:hypothetical protein